MIENHSEVPSQVRLVLVDIGESGLGMLLRFLLEL